MEEKISDVIEQKLKERREEIIGIETIQDMVEECLFEQQRFRTAKAYILYRKEKEQHREEGKYRLLSREFLSSYKHTPNPMEQLGAFVYSPYLFQVSAPVRETGILVGDGSQSCGV